MFRFEIIETYWNVNTDKPEGLFALLSEIIETYWNVNHMTHATITVCVSRNNRNILECKCQFDNLTV